MKTLTRRAKVARSTTESLAAPVPPELLTGPTHEALVRAHAYRLYEQRGGVDGHALEDWLAAEAEVAALASDAAPAPQPA